MSLLKICFVGIINHVVVYANLNFGALVMICEGYKIRKLKLSNRARSHAIARNFALTKILSIA